MPSIQVTTTIGSNQFIVTLDSAFMAPAGCSAIERHNHIAFEFMYILEGSCIIKSEDKKIELSKNQYSFIAPGVYHDQTAPQPVLKSSLSIERIKHQPAEEYYPSKEDALLSEELDKLSIAFSSDDGTILELIMDIRRELSEKRVGYYAALQSLLSQLIINIIRNCCSQTSAEYETPTRRLSDTRSRDIEHFFEYNYNTKASISDLSKQLFVSNRQTVRILRQKYDMSFKQKIIEKRIEIAKTLLSSTQLPIKDIADHIGYDTANFSAMFKQKTGLSPKQYRQQSS